LCLIDALKRSGAGRIINVSSGTHSSGTGVIENIISPADYDGRLQYANSKLANILFAYALAKKLKGSKVTANAVNPGGVATNFARNNGLKHWLKHRVYYLAKGELLSPGKGAETVVELASSPDVEGFTSGYYVGKKEQRSAEISYDSVLQEQLWAKSVALSGTDLRLS
jgi:NAD(P)-dependent dehydrogenase (short-subunit alcohol dehydrogenase family)